MRLSCDIMSSQWSKYGEFSFFHAALKIELDKRNNFQSMALNDLYTRGF